MTTLKHLLIILAAALLVVAGTLAWNQLAGDTTASQPERQPPTGERFSAGDAPAAFSGHAEEGASGGLAALGALFKNVGVVTALTVAVAAVTTVWDLARKWNQRGAPRTA